MTKFLMTTAMVFGLALPGVAQNQNDARIKELVYEAIRENPDIIREAIEMLQTEAAEAEAAAAADALVSNREALEQDPNAPVLGNPDGDVTVVEFFDYNCGYCRRVSENVASLIDGDDNVRLVMREWPILGEESVYAARASLASRAQGKYEEFHKALMANSGRANEASVMKIAADIGLDIDQLKVDMQAPEIDEHIAGSQALTQQLGLNGTPAFVFGEQLVPGAIELDQMQALVEAARS